MVSLIRSLDYRTQVRYSSSEGETAGDVIRVYGEGMDRSCGCKRPLIPLTADFAFRRERMVDHGHRNQLVCCAAAFIGFYALSASRRKGSRTRVAFGGLEFTTEYRQVVPSQLALARVPSLWITFASIHAMLTYFGSIQLVIFV